MISEKQLLANRSNCLKFTGPQSPQGKRTVSRNAVRHGLLSNSDEILIQGENQDEFDSFRQNLRDDLRPVGQLETLLAERITGFFWKLKRAGRMEKGLLEILCNPSSNSDATDKKKELPFVMITTKTYATPSDDPEFQEFKKRKQQQTAACGLDPSKGMVSPETFESSRLLGTREPRPDNDTESSSSETLGRAISRDFKDGRLLERLLTYEGRIERSLYKALAELQKFQFIRKTNKAISNDDQAEVLHDNNDQNKLAGNTDHPESPLRGEGPVDSISSNKSVQSACPRTSLSGVQSVVSVPLDTPKPNKAILAQRCEPHAAMSDSKLLSDSSQQDASLGCTDKVTSVSGHPESPLRGEGPVDSISSNKSVQSACPRTSLSGAKSAVPVPLDTPETNKAILIPCLTQNHPPKPLAEGGVDNCVCKLHAVRRSTCGCLR